MNTDNYFAYNGIGFYVDQSVLSLVLKGNNLLISSIRKVAHAPLNKISSLIYDSLPTIQEKKEITATDFKGRKIGYEHHLDLKVAVKVMNSEKARELREQLFMPENEVETFLQLEGIAGGVPLEENRAKYNQLLLLLEENNALKKSTNATSSTGLTREEVLREFIFAFIETKFFTSEMVSAGLRYALIPAISWICPPLGSTIKFIDGFDLVRPLCQESTVDPEGLARHRRRQKIAKYKEKLRHASETPTSASSGLDVNAPLLATGMTAAALAVQAPQPGRNIVPIAGALTLVGASLMVGYQFLRSSQEVANNNGLILTDNEMDVPQGSVSYGNRPPALDLHLNSTVNSTCYEVVEKIRKLLRSSQSGIRLADEFSQFIFDENIDLRIKHAKKVIATMNVTEFTCHDRDQMNNLLIDIFSVLLTPPGSKQVLNMAKLINIVNMKVSKIWRDNANGTQNDSIGKAIQGLYSYILRVIVNLLQTTESEKLERIIKFVINFPAPDFIQFLNHGLSNESVISKSLNDYWIAMGVEYPKNKYITFGDFKSALDRGELLTFRLARVKVYLGDSGNATEVNKYQKYDRVINKHYQDYHELDINLERTRPVSVRDVARSKYEILGVDIDKETYFERPTFKIHRTPLRKPEYPVIIECKDLFCVLMSFPDGIKVLYDLMPNSVPAPLRKYPYEGETVFTLKPHPLRAEIKSDYEKLYKLFEDEHLYYYEKVVTKAFNITTRDFRSYLSNPDMVYSLVDGHSKRFHVVQYLFIQTASKLNPEVLSNAAFNERTKTEGGVIFFGENIKTGKRTYFLLNPEIARQSQLFPVITLSINATRDIQRLDDETLNRHYFFKDGRSYWDRCETVEKPTLGWTDNAVHFFDFYSSWTKYGLSKACELITPSWEIIPWFEEKKLGPAAIAIPLIIEKAIENRKAFLSWQKQKVDESMLTRGEKEEQLGTLGIMLEQFPLKSCYDSVNKLLLTSVDEVPIDDYEKLLKVLSCGVELLLPRSVIKMLKGVGRAISKVNLQKLNIIARKNNLDAAYKLAHSLPHTSKQQMSPLIESQIKSEVANLEAAKAMLNKLETERFNKIVEILGIFPAYKYPLTNLKPFGTNLFNLVEVLKGYPGIFTLAKKELNEYYQQHKFHPFSRWIAPQGNRSLEIENYMFPLPASGVTQCYSDTVKVSNLTINIFEIHQKDPGLYKDILFSELKSGSIEQVIETARAGGWTIAVDYDPLAMFAFRSFTPELRKYVMQILDLGNYYNLNPNRTDVDANFFYDYLKDNFDKEQPATIQNLILTPEQNILLAHARQNIKDILKSNTCAFENNYRFVLQYILLSKTQEVLTQLSDETTKDRIVRMLLPEVFYYLQRFTVNTKKSSAQENYHLEAINFLASRIKYKLAENPAAITLFCENLSYFDDNVDSYLKRNPDANMPTMSEYVSESLLIKNRLKVLYERYARIEYTASVFNDYLIDDWLGVDAQTAWLANMQAFLTPEMRYQNLTPFLADATKIVIAEWKKVLSTVDATHDVKIMHDDEMHAEFIAIVQKAFAQSCRIHKNQLFCQYYTLDNGSFTFIKHDFIAERKPRLLSRRLVERDHPDVFMPVVEYKGMMEEFTASRKLLESWQAVTDAMMYQQELNNVVLKFISFSPLTFHERLYGYALSGPDRTLVQADDVIIMINSIINENGRLVDYQLRVLQRYLPVGMVMDTDRVLELLSDLLRLKHPNIPRLYSHVIFYLQTPLAGADVTLRQLSDGSFAREQVNTVMRRFAMLLESEQGAMINAVRRYVRAAIHHLLDFTRHLAVVDPALIDSVAGEGIGRQLCLGAIIAQQLGWENVVHGDLVRLYSLAIRDAGIVPMNALSRLALFNMPGNNLAEDALAAFGYAIDRGAKILTPLVACINDNQRLMASLAELTFDNATPLEHRLLRELVLKAIQNQQEILTLAMPAQKEQQFRAAYARGELQLTWYLAREANSTGEFTAAGVGFDIVNQQGGLIFPLGLPVPESGMFLQTPVHISNRTLTAACFDDGQIGKMQFKRKTVTPAPSQDKENSGVVTLLTHYLETRSQNFQQQLAHAKNASEFNTIKERFQQWLTQFFAFYRDSSSLYEQLDAERIIQLAAETDVKSWINGQRPKPKVLSTGDYVEQAIRGLMSRYTDYPDDAAKLRTRTPVDNTLSPASLPENGFAGVWWDPMSYCCYLGFINDDEDQLFASLVDKRATLFPLADKHAHATIWQSLSLATELQLNLTAMRNGEITATEFFDQYVSDAWRKQHDQAEERWQLMPTEQASALIEQGVMTPLSYLQKTAAVNSTTTKLTPYILQYHNGNFVFVLSKDDYQNIRYRVLDPSGQLQVLPVEASQWPQTVIPAPGKTARQQFRATVDRFLAEEEKKHTPTFLPLLNIQQQRNIRAALLLRQKASAEQLRQLANVTAGIPYRFNVEDDRLMEIEQHLHAYETTLILQLQERIRQPVDISSVIGDVFMWRKANLYDLHIFNNTLQDLKSREVVLSTLDRFIKRGVKMAQFPGKDSISWVADKLNILNHTIAAFEWFRSERKPPSPSRADRERLYQNCLAENNFFSRYGTYPHCTPDIFQQPWSFEIDQHPSPLNVPAWQAGFNLLRQLTAGLTGCKLLNTFLALNAEEWQEAHMRNHTRIFEQQLNRTVSYWQQPHNANDIMIIRPTISPFGFDLATAKRQKPTQLILTARIGSVSPKEKASPFLAGPEVAEELLLENVRQADTTVTEARLAGISRHPHTAKEFVAWTKHRLAGPLFMSELSSPAFLWRLQHRIRQVIATEAELWREDERRFYRSSPTHHFLNIADFTADNKSQRLAFFQALYASELLIVRLIMPDAEMVFGMLCALAPKQDDDVTYAWVCLKDTHENIPSENRLPTIHLVGV